MGFNFALVLDIKPFKGIVHIIKVNIIYIIFGIRITWNLTWRQFC